MAPRPVTVALGSSEDGHDKIQAKRVRLNLEGSPRPATEKAKWPTTKGARGALDAGPARLGDGGTGLQLATHLRHHGFTSSPAEVMGWRHPRLHGPELVARAPSWPQVRCLEVVVFDAGEASAAVGPDGGVTVVESCVLDQAPEAGALWFAIAGLRCPVKLDREGAREPPLPLSKVPLADLKHLVFKSASYGSPAVALDCRKSLSLQWHDGSVQNHTVAAVALAIAPPRSHPRPLMVPCGTGAAAPWPFLIREKAFLQSRGPS